MCHDGQVPAEMQTFIMVLEQRLLEPLEGDTPSCEIRGYRVLPLIIPFGGSPKWMCMESKLSVDPGDIVYGRQSYDGRIQIVFISGPK